AKIDLTPRLSVGTAEPESIYEARFEATLDASAPLPVTADGTAMTGNTEKVVCEMRLPLPPQIISLADVSVMVGGEASENVSLRDSALIWTGKLPATPTPIKVTYSAVGKGLYVLQT